MTGLRYNLSARLLSTTLMLLNAIAALATHGGTSVCVSGHSAPAASGMDSTLYEYAHTKLKMTRLWVSGRGQEAAQKRVSLDRVLASCPFLSVLSPCASPCLPPEH